MADSSLSSLAALADSEALYGLEELLAAAGERLGEEITPRTVRLYATEGLIDRPGKEGRRALYTHRHLLQLLLIRTLARRGLSLTAIAPLVVCSDEELAEQLLHLAEPSSHPVTPSAPPGVSPQQGEALAYLQSIHGAASLASSSDRAPSLLPLLGSPITSSSPSGSPRRSLSTRSAGRWHRLSLAPGVELHLSESASIPPAGSRREAWLQRLIDRLREQLDHQD